MNEYKVERISQEMNLMVTKQTNWGFWEKINFGFTDLFYEIMEDLEW